MGSYFHRLVTTGAAYQAARVLSGLLALFTLPLYTRHLSPTEYGYAEPLLTFIILTSIVLRMGARDEACQRAGQQQRTPGAGGHRDRQPTSPVASSRGWALIFTGS